MHEMNRSKFRVAYVLLVGVILISCASEPADVHGSAITLHTLPQPTELDQFGRESLVLFEVAALALVHRELPDRASQFSVEIQDVVGGNDGFEISVQNDKIVLSGNTGASALNCYSKYTANTHLSWAGDQLDLPEILPFPGRPTFKAMVVHCLSGADGIRYLGDGFVHQFRQECRTAFFVPGMRKPTS